MKKFNPLDHPICLSPPLRLAPTAWAAHIPFAMFLVDLLRPRVIVELGTFSGVSYCAFCQAVKELELDARCYAVDTWQGDEQNGFYGAEILADLKEHHDPLYANFSCLIQSTFDDALARFEEGTIDLLHVDGYHTYEAVKNDFDRWLPKISSRGVILFHDINVREKGFGVWRLWEELKPLYRHFEFAHEHGLGVLATGTIETNGIGQLLEMSEQDGALFREFFNQLGQRLRASVDKDVEARSKEQIISTLATELEARRQMVQTLSAETERLSIELAAKDTRLNNILNSRAWRWVSRYGRVKNRLLFKR